MKLMVHVDDFLVTGDLIHLDWLHLELKKDFELSCHMLGGTQDAQEGILFEMLRLLKQFLD